MNLFRRANRKPRKVDISFDKILPLPGSKPHTEMSYEDDILYIDGMCPSCGSRVTVDFTCHTFGGREDGTGWMACIGCSSAGYLSCTECTWDYTWGLNPKNHRSVSNRQRRPSWLVGDWPY